MIPELQHFQQAVDRLSEWEPSYKLEQRIAEARRRMGPERWAELQAEWGE
jgi:tRNA 2-selenouridine synthase SelU